jgi:hypothetical protein
MVHNAASFIVRNGPVTHTSDTKLGVHFADLPTDKIPVAHQIVFTFLWEAEDRWEGVDYTVVAG